MWPLGVRPGDPVASESQGPLFSGSLRGNVGSWEADVSQLPAKPVEQRANLFVREQFTTIVLETTGCIS